MKTKRDQLKLKLISSNLFLGIVVQTFALKLSHQTDRPSKRSFSMETSQYTNLKFYKDLGVFFATSVAFEIWSKHFKHEISSFYFGKNSVCELAKEMNKKNYRFQRSLQQVLVSFFGVK